MLSAIDTQLLSWVASIVFVLSAGLVGVTPRASRRDSIVVIGAGVVLPALFLVLAHM